MEEVEWVPCCVGSDQVSFLARVLFLLLRGLQATVDVSDGDKLLVAHRGAVTGYTRRPSRLLYCRGTYSSRFVGSQLASTFLFSFLSLPSTPVGRCIYACLRLCL